MKIKDLLGIDYLMLSAAALLTLFGVLFIYSSGISLQNSTLSTEYIKQIIWGSVGVVLAVLIALLNYRRVYHASSYLYAASLVLLVWTLMFGREVNGAKAWLGIGSFGIQVSEFAKITTIIFLAYYLDMTRHSINYLKRFVLSVVIVMLPMLLILAQPDFGTSLVFIPILLVMTFVAGVQLRYIAFFGLIIGLTGIFTLLPFWQEYIVKRNISLLLILKDIRFIAVFSAVMLLVFFLSLFGLLRFKKRYFYWINYFVLVLVFSVGAAYGAGKVLKTYQIMRLVVFLDPHIDPQGSGWNIIQSITAIGSGGFLGKGYLQGTQSHYRFIPQQSTDFIFSIFSEEWGFLGGVLLFVLFLIIVMRLISITKSTKDPFGGYITAGLAAMYIFHFLINVGMTMGIMPITGIPLLFVSYGGSSLISAMIGIGLAISVYIRRFQA